MLLSAVGRFCVVVTAPWAAMAKRAGARQRVTRATYHVEQVYGTPAEKDGTDMAPQCPVRGWRLAFGALRQAYVWVYP